MKRDEFDRGTKIMDFTGLQESVADNMELLKSMAPKKKHFYQKLKEKKEVRAKESENNAIEEGDDEEGDEEEGGDDEISAIVRQSSEARTAVDGGNVSPKLPPMSKKALEDEIKDEEARKNSIMNSGFVAFRPRR